MAPLLDEATLRRLERLQLRVRRGIASRPAGERVGRPSGRTADFSDHRPYTPGDDLRSVDWPAYARHGRLYVKVGPGRQGVEISVEVDASASMRWGHPPKLTSALRLAAGLGYLALAGGDRLRLSLLGEAESVVWGPASGSRQIPAFLEAVEAASRARHRGWEPAALPLPTRRLCVLLSDLYSTGRLLRWLETPRAGRQALVLHVLHPEELQPRLSGRLELLPATGGPSLWLGVDASVLQAYRRALGQWLEELAGQAAQRQAAYELVPTDQPLERQVLPYLWARGHLDLRED